MATLYKDLEHLTKQLGELLSYNDPIDEEYIHSLKRDIERIKDELWVEENAWW
jgi:hypothetical protein